jgi:hypothetical protein
MVAMFWKGGRRSYIKGSLELWHARERKCLKTNKKRDLQNEILMGMKPAVTSNP